MNSPTRCCRSLNFCYGSLQTSASWSVYLGQSEKDVLCLTAQLLRFRPFELLVAELPVAQLLRAAKQGCRRVAVEVDHGARVCAVGKALVAQQRGKGTGSERRVALAGGEAELEAVDVLAVLAALVVPNSKFRSSA